VYTYSAVPSVGSMSICATTFSNVYIRINVQSVFESAESVPGLYILLRTVFVCASVGAACK
jgi:hypothetical protein